MGAIRTQDLMGLRRRAADCRAARGARDRLSLCASLGFVLRILGCALMLALADAAAGHALEFRLEKAPDGAVFLSAEGSLHPGDAGRLAALLQNRPQALVLHSTGGALSAGLELAELVRRVGLPVMVPAGGTCASACFLVLAASPQRFAGADARIGVHSAASGAGTEDRESLAATTLMAREAERFGVPPQIVTRMILSGPQRMVWLDAQDQAAMGIRRLPIPSETPPRPPMPDSFAEGRRDRAAWEAWLAGLPAEARAGARYWAGLGPRRPGASCGRESEQFRQGCLQAGEYGATLEARAAQDLAWRHGWDSGEGPSGYAW